MAYDFDKDLTTFTMSGHLTAAEMQVWMDEYYADRPTTLVLCDITEANLSELNTNDVRDFADHYRKFAGIREGGNVGNKIGHCRLTWALLIQFQPVLTLVSI